MSVENALTVFSIRIPVALAERINSRGERHYRSRNSEIAVLLNMAIDLAEARDKREAEAPLIH